MRRVHYSVAMSLDGYVAGPNGEADWIVMDPEIDFGAMMSQFDTILLGRRTYQASRSLGGSAGMPGVTAYVISTTLTQEDCPGAILMNDPQAALSEIRQASGKDIWLFGGGSLFRSLLGLGLVDVISVAVIPVLLGGGIPLLPPTAERAKLELTAHRVYRNTGTVSLEYAVRRR